MAKNSKRKPVKKAAKKVAKKVAKKSSAKKASNKKAPSKKAPAKKAAAKKIATPAPANSINPYLTFKNNCEAAFNFYRSVFGGKFTYIGRFKEMPPMEGMPVNPAE